MMEAQDRLEEQRVPHSKQALGGDRLDCARNSDVRQRVSVETVIEHLNTEFNHLCCAQSLLVCCDLSIALRVASFQSVQPFNDVANVSFNIGESSWVGCIHLRKCRVQALHDLVVGLLGVLLETHQECQ